MRTVPTFATFTIRRARVNPLYLFARVFVSDPYFAYDYAEVFRKGPGWQQRDIQDPDLYH